MDDALARLGIPVPDSAIARRARELVADVAPPYLVNHSIRAYAWAVELALHDDLRFDPEILYVSATLHDVGLLPAYDLGGSFELDSAVAAMRLCESAGAPREHGNAVYEAIALHNDPTLPADAASEVWLIWDATGVDVTGDRFSDVRPSFARDVLAAYPRLGFKREFSSRFADQAARKPASKAAALVRAGILEEIEQAPFES